MTCVKATGHHLPHGNVPWGRKVSPLLINIDVLPTVLQEGKSGLLYAISIFASPLCKQCRQSKVQPPSGGTKSMGMGGREVGGRLTGEQLLNGAIRHGW